MPIRINGFSFNEKMKGIMFDTLLKLILALYFGTCLVCAATKGKNGTITTITTTTTAKPQDYSGSETRHYETAVNFLRPGESLSRSVSYSQSSQNYEQHHPNYDKGKYEESKSGYESNQRPSEEYYKGSDGNYVQKQLDDNSNSYESPYQQQHPEDQKQSYDAAPEQRSPHVYPDHAGAYPDHASKDQSSYELLDYSKGSPYESTKEANGYEGGRPPFHYAYEVTGHPQKESYSQDAGNKGGKTEYGSGETDLYSPSVIETPEHYPKPNPTRYISQNTYEDNYKSEEQKASYYPEVPKDVGYASNGAKELGYLQNPQHETSYSKEAGYSPRNPDPTAFIPMLPKEKPGLTQDGKVAVYIKHLGHKTPGTNQYVHKERQGFLLLPVVQQKMEEKLKELKEQLKQDYQSSYQGDEQTRHKQSPVIEKQIYVHPERVQYQANTKTQHGPAYSLDHVPVKQEVKTVVSHGGYEVHGPVIKHVAYTNSQYESPKAHVYSTGDNSEAVVIPHAPQTVPSYQGVPVVKTYYRRPVVYNGPPPKLVSRVTDTVKYEPASLYEKAPEYISPYDATAVHKSVPVKVKEDQPLNYESLYRSVSYPRIVDYTSIADKAKRRYLPTLSHAYSTQYRNSAAGLATAYEHPSLDARKPFALFLHKTKEPSVPAFQPTSYSSKGRLSAKALVDGFGLHDYESLLSKPGHASSLDSSLYYDLHSFPAHHAYSRFGYRRSGLVAKKSS